MLSVNTVEPMNRPVSSSGPITVHCRIDPAATQPKRNRTHHCACSKKKFGCRDNRNSPLCRNRG